MKRSSLESWEGVILLVVVVSHSCFVFVSSQSSELSNLQIGVGPTGQVLLLLILLMVALIGIPIYLWIWRNYLKKIVNKITGKVQVRFVKIANHISRSLICCIILLLFA